MDWATASATPGGAIGTDWIDRQARTSQLSPTTKTASGHTGTYSSRTAPIKLTWQLAYVQEVVRAHGSLHDMVCWEFSTVSLGVVAKRSPSAGQGTAGRQTPTLAARSAPAGSGAIDRPPASDRPRPMTRTHQDRCAPDEPHHQPEDPKPPPPRRATPPPAEPVAPTAISPTPSSPSTASSDGVSMRGADRTKRDESIGQGGIGDQGQSECRSRVSTAGGWVQARPGGRGQAEWVGRAVAEVGPAGRGWRRACGRLNTSGVSQAGPFQLQLTTTGPTFAETTTSHTRLERSSHSQRSSRVEICACYWGDLRG